MKKVIFLRSTCLSVTTLFAFSGLALETKPSTQVELFNQFKACIKTSVAQAKSANSPFLFEAVCQSERLALQSNMTPADFAKLQSALKTMSEQLLAQ